MAGKKGSLELDKGFEEQPLDLDPGFEEVPSESSGPSQGEALARGLGKGVTFGLQAPLAGLGAAATQAVTGNQGPQQGRDLPALLAAYQQMKNEQIQKNAQAQKSFPKTFGAGELAGGIPTAIATGGAAPGLATAAAQGATAGAGNYVGSVPTPNLKDAVTNTGAGMMAGTVLHQAAPGAIEAVGDALNAIRSGAGKVKSMGQSMVPQSVDTAFDMGKNRGINLLSKEAQQKILPEAANKASDNLTKRMLNAKDSLMADVDTPLKEATDGGMLIDHSAPMKTPPENMQHFSQDDGTIDQPDMEQDVEDLTNQDQYAGLGEDEELSSSIQNKPSFIDPFAKAKAQIDYLKRSDASFKNPDRKSGEMAEKLYNTITQYKVPEAGEEPHTLVDQYGNNLSTTAEGGEDAENRTVLTPMESRNLYNDVSSYGKVLAANDQSKLANVAFDFANSIKDRLKAELPDYAEASERLNQFQKYLPETLMSGGNSPEDTGIKLSDSASQYMDIKEPLHKMISKLSKQGTSTDEAKQTFNKLQESMDTLNTLENARKANAELNSKPFESTFEKIGMSKDEILNFLRNQSQDAAVFDMMKSGSVPLSTPKSFTQAVSSAVGKGGVVAANQLGRAKAGGSIIFNAPKDVLYAVADKLSKNPAVAHLSAGLRSAIASGDLVKQNAAIFAIMQNPTAKSIIDPNLNDIENESSSLPKRSPYNTEF
jgi:hypothetical protein